LGTDGGVRHRNGQSRTAVAERISLEVRFMRGAAGTTRILTIRDPRLNFPAIGNSGQVSGTSDCALGAVNCFYFRFHQWQANLRVLELTEIKSIPYVPLSHPFVERLIGTLRREYLDHMLFWTAAHLENKLLDFRTHFNCHRTHTSREGRTPDTPVSQPIANLRSFRWQPHCRSSYQTPMAA
jgi:Integrase core domain